MGGRTTSRARSATQARTTRKPLKKRAYGEWATVPEKIAR